MQQGGKSGDKCLWETGLPLQIIAWEGQGSDGGDSPFMGYGPPHPPMLGTPDFVPCTRAILV